MTFGPDGLLYAGNSGSNVLVINTVTQSVVAQISLLGNVANGGLAFGSDGLLYAGNSGFDFLVIDPVSRSIVAQINTGGHYANGGLAFGPDGLLYAGNSGPRILVIDPVARSVIAQISLQGNIANGGLAFRTIGSTSLVTINLTLRAKNEYGKTNKQFLKKDYFSGNFNFNKNDLFKRDTFSTSVSVRNM